MALGWTAAAVEFGSQVRNAIRSPSGVGPHTSAKANGSPSGTANHTLRFDPVPPPQSENAVTGKRCCQANAMGFRFGCGRGETPLVFGVCLTASRASNEIRLLQTLLHPA
jgi:hypothetical protein